MQHETEAKFQRNAFNKKRQRLNFTNVNTRRFHLFLCLPKAKQKEPSSLKDVGQLSCTNPYVPVSPNRHYYFFSSSRPFNLEGWGGKEKRTPPAQGNKDDCNASEASTESPGPRAGGAAPPAHPGQTESRSDPSREGTHESRPALGRGLRGERGDRNTEKFGRKREGDGRRREHLPLSTGQHPVCLLCGYGRAAGCRHRSSCRN